MAYAYDDPALKTSVSIIYGCDVESPGFRVLREHGSPNWLFIFTEIGHGQCVVNGKIYDLKPGTLAMWSPGTYHEYYMPECSTEWEQMWIHAVLSPAYTSIASTIIEGKNFALLTPDASLEAGRLFRTVTSFARSPINDLRAFNMLERLLLDLSPTEVSIQRRGPVERALEYLRRHLSDPIGVEDLARAAKLSPSRLTTLFRQQLGVAPRALIERERVAHAKQLLRMSNRSILQIAEDVGYESPFYFSLRFKKLTGVNPTDYRKQAVKQDD